MVEVNGIDSDYKDFIVSFVWVDKNIDGKSD
jgi:hypothetical protein